jgi:hypothetical protein
VTRPATTLSPGPICRFDQSFVGPGDRVVGEKYPCRARFDQRLDENRAPLPLPASSRANTNTNEVRIVWDLATNGPSSSTPGCSPITVMCSWLVALQGGTLVLTLCASHPDADPHRVQVAVG